MWLLMLMVVAAHGPLAWSFPTWLWMVVMTYATASAAFQILVHTPSASHNINDVFVSPNTQLETFVETFQQAYDRNFHGFRDRLTKGRQ